MANTFSQITAQYVFAVQGRQNFIFPEIETDLYKYITGIVKAKGQSLLAINGMPDHIHMLVSMKPDLSFSELIKEVKRSSTLFMNDKYIRGHKFSWQEGFGVFKYTRSMVPAVANYIANQKEHHKRKTFREEFLKILKDTDTKFDEKYLFEFYE